MSEDYNSNEDFLKDQETRIIEKTSKDSDLNEIYEIDVSEYVTENIDTQVLVTEDVSTEIIKSEDCDDHFDNTQTPDQIDKNKPWRKYIKRRIGDG
jgi:hypothetical protein